MQDPVTQLEALARRQSEVLTSKLGKDESGREIPTRPLPYGSESARSPTYLPQGPPSQVNTIPAYPKRPTVDRATLTEKPILVERGINTENIFVEKGVNTENIFVERGVNTENIFVERGVNTENTAEMEKPSFTGPGAMWEKYETFPTQGTPLGASEEEKDVLET